MPEVRRVSAGKQEIKNIFAWEGFFMSFAQDMESLWNSVKGLETEYADWMERLRSEIEVAGRFAEHRSDKTAEYQLLIKRALETFVASAPVDGVADAVIKAEDVLEPLGKALKEYTIHCCGHAHIDMNWLWPWQETISTTRDTFTTVDRLMDLFPDFHFSQDQASTYFGMEVYSPEVFEMIRRRIAEGRWDLTASTWVEGEKNLASGEALVRQMLYTRRYFKERFGLPYDAVKIDWEPDMFGHAFSLPGILKRGGVSRYYFCRAGQEPKLFWWEGQDGSRVLAFQDDELWYNGAIQPEMTQLMFRFEKATGLKHYMFMYGVGDHGGGPTRRDLERFGRMSQWPVYPTIRLAKTDDFYSAVEASNPDLPTFKGELNFIFEGCYTSQSKVKRGNRFSENALPKAETLAILAGKLDQMPYPSEDLLRAWRHTLLCQFHDILPGSGIHATYEYSEGLYQEVAAVTESVITRALRRIAAKIDTASVAGDIPAEAPAINRIGPGLGAGAGDPALVSGSTNYNVGSPDAQPFIVYNPTNWDASGVVTAKVWNVDWPRGPVAVRYADGSKSVGQVMEHGHYWGHMFTSVAFPVKNVPSVGYTVVSLEKAVEQASVEGVQVHARPQKQFCPSCEGQTIALENEFLKVTFDAPSGAITSLVEKESGMELVPEGKKMGLLEILHEAPNPMSAWNIGQIRRIDRLEVDGTLDVAHRGPHRASVVSKRKYNDSSFTLEASLDAGSRSVDFHLNVNWLERGSPEIGTPFLRVAFPVNVSDPGGKYEIPFGSIDRPCNGQEVPALKWAYLGGKADNGTDAGITLVNECKYGHNADGDTLCLSLLRSSYDPDPLPELGQHHIRFSIKPIVGLFDVKDAYRLGWQYNSPLTVISTDAHKGELPAQKGFVSVETQGVVLAALKKAEDSDGLVIRLFEIEGNEVTATVKLDPVLAPEGATAVEVDLLEQPLPESSASLSGCELKVKIPSHGIASVLVG